MSETLELLIDDICSADPRRVAEALQAASPRREELKSILLARLRQAAAEPSRWLGGKQPSPTFLCFLAAEWRLAEAHPLIVALLRLPPDQSDAMLGDFMTDGARLVLADTWPGDPGTFTALALDPAASPYARNAAVDAAALLSVRGDLPGSELRQLIEKIAALPLDADNDQEVTMASLVVGTILDLKARELEPVVTAMFERGLIDPSICGDRDEVFAELAQPGDPASSDTHRFPPPIASAWEEVRQWCFFTEPEETEEEIDQPPEPLPADEEVSPYRDPVTIRYSTPKIGRNDPCPCGSGKKYKKCCGA